MDCSAVSMKFFRQDQRISRAFEKGRVLQSAAKPVQFAPVALGWSTRTEGFKPGQRLPLFRRLEPQFLAFLGLPVKRLRYSGRAADVAELQDLHLEFAAIVLYAKQITFPHLTRGLHLLPATRDSAELAGTRSERTRLEEPGRPKPLVDPHAGHASILVRDGILIAPTPVVASQQAVWQRRVEREYRPRPAPP